MQHIESLREPVEKLHALLGRYLSGEEPMPYSFIWAATTVCQEPDVHTPGDHWDYANRFAGDRTLLNVLLEFTENAAAELLFGPPKEVPLDDQ